MAMLLLLLSGDALKADCLELYTRAETITAAVFICTYFHFHQISES